MPKTLAHAMLGLRDEMRQILIARHSLGSASVAATWGRSIAWLLTAAESQRCLI